MQTIKKIVQMADIHIMKYDRHEEYLYMFKLLKDKLKEELAGLEYDEIRIVVCGDIAHQKNNISPEMSIIMGIFFKTLTSIAPTIIFAGNHDFLINNMDRMDCITPIVKIGGFDNLHYLDLTLRQESGYVVDNNICWALYSSFDDFAKPNALDEFKSDNPNIKIIGLYHGSVVGAKTDNGVIMDTGIETSVFGPCDVVLAGHIHKRQEIVRQKARIVYAGSLIQQDISENVSGHGFLIWDTYTLEYKAYDLENPYSTYKMRINSIDDVSNNNEKILNL